MDSKQNSTNQLNALTQIILGVNNAANMIIQMAETGEGMDLPDDKKEELKKWATGDGKKEIESLKTNMNNLRDTIKKANGANNPANK